MKEKTLAYAAGILDAEGCLSIGRSSNDKGYISYDPLIRFTTTFLPLQDWWVEKFGGTFKTRVWGDGSDNKDYCQWRFGNDIHARKFLDLAQKYLVLKKEESEVLMEYYNLNGKQCPSKREELFLRIGELKNRSSVTTNMPSFPDNNAYLAGFFDGEGSSFIVKFKQGYCNGFGYRSAVSLGNTYKPIILHLKDKYEGVWRERPPNNGVLPMYEWELKQQKQQKRFILSVLPYLHIKREQSNAVLKFIRLAGERNPAKREMLYRTTRTLNGKKIESELIGDYESDTVVIQ